MPVNKGIVTIHIGNYNRKHSTFSIYPQIVFPRFAKIVDRWKNLIRIRKLLCKLV